MATNDQFLTTGEFASQAKISTSTVTKMIKEGKIKAEKKSGKWRIAADQLDAEAVKDLKKPGKSTARKKTAAPAEKKAAVEESSAPKKEKPIAEKQAASKTYSLAEFVGMTYLTETGVRRWLKEGRLTGRQGAGGEWEIDADNLERPDVKHLVR